MGFVGELVVGEASVAIDAEEAFLGGAHVIGREVEHGVGDFADDGEHGLFELGLVGGFALVEPVAVVVLLKAAEEFEGFGAEVGGGGGGGF